MWEATRKKESDKFSSGKQREREKVTNYQAGSKKKERK